jgi:ribosome recycling factor
MQKSGDISEDDLRRFQDQVQKVTDGHVKQLEKIEAAKDKEITEA